MSASSATSDLGAYGALAFDALKSLRYSRLELTLDGALDGEFLTRIDIDGIARDLSGTRQPPGRDRRHGGRPGAEPVSPASPSISTSASQGPLRALVATARSFQDPSELIRAALPGLLDRGQSPIRGGPHTPPEPTVQPQESEPVR